MNSSLRDKRKEEREKRTMVEQCIKLRGREEPDRVLQPVVAFKDVCRGRCETLQIFIFTLRIGKVSALSPGKSFSCRTVKFVYVGNG